MREQAQAARRVLEAARALVDDPVAALQGLYREDVVVHAGHPLEVLEGRAAVLERLWRPLFAAVPDLERHDAILLEGSWNGARWVAAQGHFVGTFERDWLGIPSTGGAIALRYGEFSRIEEGRMVEVRLLFDLVDLARQAGVMLLPPCPGSPERWPAPATQDGLRLCETDPAAGAATLALALSMGAGLGSYNGRSLESMGQERFWDVRRMMWYGPAGIGTTRGLSGFQRFHQIPFLTAFPDRRGGDHVCRLGSGTYAAWTGWPSVRATHRGPYLGVPASGRRVGMRVMDFYRREGDRLVENWVLIDLLDLFRQIGVELLARLPGRRAAGSGGGTAG